MCFNHFRQKVLIDIETIMDEVSFYNSLFKQVTILTVTSYFHCCNIKKLMTKISYILRSSSPVMHAFQIFNNIPYPLSNTHSSSISTGKRS